LRLPSQLTERPRFVKLAAALLVAALGAILPSAVSGAATAPLTVIVDANAAFDAELVLSCEAPAAPATQGVDIGGAATAQRHVLAVPGPGGVQIEISDLADGTACNITASGPEAAHLDAVDGGTTLVGSDGQVRGVAVTVDRGTPVTAHLTFMIPAVIPTTVPRTEAIDVENAAGSGSAALAPPLLPGSDGAASAAAPVALAAARSTTMTSSAALPDPSGSGTALVLASIGVLLCGAAAYAMVLFSRRSPRVQ